MIQGPRAEDIQHMFSEVAIGYDKANDAMTFGMARLWRKEVVRWSGIGEGGNVLDCATGTGDLAIDFKKAVGSTGTVVGTDFCKEMLQMAPPKAERAGAKIEFKWADVMNLPFENNRFDVASIAYGIRNVADPIRAIQEMARTVKPGGYVMILETGDAPSQLFKHAYDFYFRQVVPRIGGWVTGKRFAYEYLCKSSKSFPGGKRFMAILNQADVFEKCEYRTLIGGASFIYKCKVRI